MYSRFAVPVVIATLGAACSTPPMETGASRQDAAEPVDGVVYRAETSFAGGAMDTIRTAVTATNTSSQPVRIEFGACAVTLRAYRDPARTGDPAWAAARRPNPDPETGIYRACPLYLAFRDLAPGESVQPEEFRYAVTPREILGDSLPAGRYYLTAILSVDQETIPLAAGAVVLGR